MFLLQKGSSHLKIKKNLYFPKKMANLGLKELFKTPLFKAKGIVSSHEVEREEIS